MNYKEDKMVRAIMRANPCLKHYNTAKMSDRLFKTTKGNMFLTFNGFTNKYELHSVKSFKYNSQSFQASFKDDRMLNGWLVRDVRANDLEKFRDEVSGERKYLEGIHDDQVEMINGLMGIQLEKYLESTLGRRV